jgi:hypothetical protein
MSRCIEILEGGLFLQWLRMGTASIEGACFADARLHDLAA